MARPLPRSMRNENHWAVEVRVNGLQILTIESNSLAGVDMRPEYIDAIRQAANHLLGFIGESSQ